MSLDTERRGRADVSSASKRFVRPPEPAWRVGVVWIVRVADGKLDAGKVGSCRDAIDGVDRAERLAVREERRLRVILVGACRDILAN